MGTPESRLISDLYQAALRHPPSARSAFLKEACRGDLDLQHEVESLLRYDSAAERFFESPIVDLGKHARPSMLDRQPEMIDRQLGPYKIVALLGSGGMGDVYRAREQPQTKEEGRPDWLARLM